MFCDAYNKSLTEAAAGGELAPVLQHHLASCGDCRLAFAGEQSLFAAIDTGLHAVANPDVPATLIPRIHVAVNNEPASQTHSQKWIFAAAALTAALVVAFVLKPNHWTSSSPKENVVTRIPTPPTFLLKESQTPSPSIAHAAARMSRREAGRLVGVKAESPFTAEVLVPDEERTAFEKFLKRDQSTSTTVSAVIAAVPQAPKVLEPLQPMEIASLKVPSLNGEEASRDAF